MGEVLSMSVPSDEILGPMVNRNNNFVQSPTRYLSWTCGAHLWSTRSGTPNFAPVQKDLSIDT